MIRCATVLAFATLALSTLADNPPRCPADVTFDAAVTVDDPIAFTDAFSAGDLAADLWSADAWELQDPPSTAPDGAVTIDDLLYFLERYNAGC